MVKNEFQRKVEQQVERLRTQTLRTVERDTAAKRIAWLRDRGLPGADAGFSPRRAFELLCFDYLGLAEAEVLVVRQSETEIVWRSVNPCPTLEACLELGLDTRTVCRAAYEKSTQAFLSQLDPQLRFLRSYTRIRPHADHCEEMIVRLDFEESMRLAIHEANQSRLSGNKGYGSVVLLGRDVVGRAHDTAATERDPSLHAEVNTVREAARRVGDSNLSGAVLVATCEPCPMCSALAVWANVTTVVYGASITETAGLGRSRILVGCQEMVDRSPVSVEVIGGVLGDECASLYR